MSEIIEAAQQRQSLSITDRFDDLLVCSRRVVVVVVIWYLVVIFVACRSSCVLFGLLVCASLICFRDLTCLIYRINWGYQENRRQKC